MLDKYLGGAMEDAKCVILYIIFVRIILYVILI